jgi:hypothetical protein
MRFIMAAVMFVLAVALMPSQGFPGTTSVRLKVPNAAQQNHKKLVKK